MRRARIEPDVERIGQLAILRGIDAEILVRRLVPRFDAAALDLGRGELEQRRRVRMQCLGFLVDEERQAACPTAAAATASSPGGWRSCRSSRDLPHDGKNCVASMPRQRGAAQRLRRLDAAIARHLVHPGEPLRRRAIDDRRAVPPAMHVAVRDLLGVQQRADLAQLVDDLRIGVPDPQAAEERQTRRRSGRRPAPD